MVHAQELETAVRLRLDLGVLILQDDAYGTIRWKQETDGFADFGMTFGNPGFVAYARAHHAGVPAWRPLMGWCRRLKTLFDRAVSSWSRFP
jgi:thiamine pyrophosphate-dependent acetolactate synthase large subunit-like protein